MIYFDNAATTFPKPLLVREAIGTALVRYGANPGRSGHEMSVQTAEQVFLVRAKAASLFGAAEEEQVIFTQNCTYALNTVIKGILQEGDHVIISDLEHNSVLRPVHALATRGVITYSVAQVSFDEEETVASFRACVRPNTRMILVTHGSNVFGLKLPIEKLAVLAREYGIYFAVDAAQTAGVEPIDIQKTGIDFLCMAGHKGLYGPTGTGLLITTCGKLLLPLAEGGTGSASYDALQPDFLPDHLEAGTLNTLGIIGLGAGIDFINMRGMERIARQENRIAQVIYEELHSTKGVKLYTAVPQYGSNLPVISFNLDRLGSEETTALLNQAGFAVRGGLHCAPLAHKKFGTAEGGTVRISIGAFNTMEQGEKLIDAIRKIVRTMPI